MFVTDALPVAFALEDWLRLNVTFATGPVTRALPAIDGVEARLRTSWETSTLFA